MSCDEKQEADFETAITETKFGLFNGFLLILAISSVLACQFEVASLSYVFPIAKCDLNLTLEDRGLINAVIYIGMIGSCFLWGSLADIFGRRKILITSHLLNCIFILMTSFSTNLHMLLIAKFFGGFTINGTSMALTPYLSELHNSHLRSRIPLIVGLLFNFGNTVMPLFAWSILPLTINWEISQNFELHSWNMFLILSTFPALYSGIVFILMPESPKYLIAKGDNQQALKIFQNIFVINTRKNPEEYPIKVLANSRQIYGKKNGLKEAWKQISPLFSSKYIKQLMLVCVLQFFLMMCLNSLRLWLPEIFQLINDYELKHETKTSFCRVLGDINYVSNENATSCSTNMNNSSVYINSSILGITAVAGYIAAAIIINRIGKKKMLIFLGFLSAISISSIYFTQNTVVTLCLLCLHLMSLGVYIDLIITFTVDMFPTSLRASALSLSLMSGRMGSVFGNLVLPVLLQIGCVALLFTIGAIITACILIAMLIPNTDHKTVE